MASSGGLLLGVVIPPGWSFIRVGLLSGSMINGSLLSGAGLLSGFVYYQWLSSRVSVIKGWSIINGWPIIRGGLL